MYQIAKQLLFIFSPETAHKIVFTKLRILFLFPPIAWLFKGIYAPKITTQPKELMGLLFKNSVGLAAGFDKNAQYIDVLDKLGFGFIEIGTVTPKPQSGNPKPRLFRLPKDQALINRMGFNNDGVEKIKTRLQKRKSKLIVGANIGKNKVTPNEKAVDDYIYCFEHLFDYVDYFVVNVSSPNTPNLRDLQEKGPLKHILNSLQTINQSKVNPKPLLLKIAPDLTPEQLDDIVEIVTETKINGLIATNTTISRNSLKTTSERIERIGNGGLSGAPVKDRSNEVLTYLKNKLTRNYTLIGVGGIIYPEDALLKIEKGADLIQIYTGYIYQGPAMIKKICKAITGK